MTVRGYANAREQTWYSLSLATSVMLWMVLKKPQGGINRRVRQNKEW